MDCKECGAVLTDIGGGESSTLVGYASPAGHNHDDNCLLRLYGCKNGHKVALSIRRTCKCGWKGKTSCFCHQGEKVDEWP